MEPVPPAVGTQSLSHWTAREAQLELFRILYTVTITDSISHVQTWELGHKEGWPLKNWCFWSTVLEKTLESPLGLQRNQTSPSYRNLNLNIHWKDWWAQAEAPILWPPEVKSWLTGKDPNAGRDWGREENWTGRRLRWLDGIYWAWPPLLEQDPVSPSVSLSQQDASRSLLSFSIRGQTDWKPQLQKTNQSDHMDHSLV